MVVAEALACGTPVLAMRRGSLPELIHDGITGFLCRSTDDMVDAVSRLGVIDRRACREDCERRFSADRMVERYLNVVRSVIRSNATAEDLRRFTSTRTQQLVGLRS